MSYTMDEWRRLRKISQAVFAKKCDISVSTYRNWMQRPETITIGKAYKIADVLNLNIDEINFKKESTK